MSIPDRRVGSRGRRRRQIRGKAKRNDGTPVAVADGNVAGRIKASVGRVSPAVEQGYLASGTTERNGGSNPPYPRGDAEVARRHREWLETSNDPLARWWRSLKKAQAGTSE